LNRFIVGLLGGGSVAGIMWMISQGSVAWTAAVSSIVTVLIWRGDYTTDQ
jgi:hypothetical protein